MNIIFMTKTSENQLLYSQFAIMQTTTQDKSIAFKTHVSNMHHLPIFLPQPSDFLGGSDISNCISLGLAFSTSESFGVFGISLILVKPLVDLLLCTSLGKVDLDLGVKAVATRLADFRILSRICQSLFFAR